MKNVKSIESPVKQLITHSMNCSNGLSNPKKGIVKYTIIVEIKNDFNLIELFEMKLDK